MLYEHRKQIMELGFEIHFPEDTMLEVRSVPSVLEKENFQELFYDLLNYFETDQIGQHSVEKMLRKILESRSCRKSVMFGDKMEREEMQRLLDDFNSTEWKLSCPHGRPNHIFWSLEEIGKWFHR